MRRIPILPTLVTLGNAFCGFLAIGYVVKAQMLWVQNDVARCNNAIRWAGWCILFAMIFDALDGKVARLAHATSDFGVELDSLCDVISFGVAPALLIKVLATQQHFLPRVGWITSILFMMCAALRLARFNIETDESEESHLYFNGLPSPAAAGFVASMTIMVHELRHGGEQEFAGIAKALEPIIESVLYVMPFVGVALALLMISRIRYVHVMNRLLRGQEPLDYLVKIILVTLLVVLTRPFSLPVLIGAYILSGIVIWAKEQVFARLPPQAKGDDLSRK
jgi:CDP-diacylglycerol--serine O-phosphatidyltransferase